ncbi:hypothetical protein ACFB49_43530 [Sphingomonas sp. DBB INV C78]|uniref:twin transmembrane helix small protein n=1 Tax=Sphingomonas sp. DBB INV C78 TaxID=3349434 RepID=UPI0036D31B91
MATFLTILLVLAMIATVIALSRGVITFAKTPRSDTADEATMLSSGEKQNKMMQARIGFQAAAIIVVILILLMARGGS